MLKKHVLLLVKSIDENKGKTNILNEFTVKFLYWNCDFTVTFNQFNASMRNKSNIKSNFFCILTLGGSGGGTLGLMVELFVLKQIRNPIRWVTMLIVYANYATTNKYNLGH